MREVNRLTEMHTYCRPHGSDAETAFTDRFVKPTGAERDLFGNWHLQIGTSPIIWSCHTDTVHRVSGRQTLHYNGGKRTLELSRRSRRKSSCLGADDTVGVFLCCEMIARQVPGHYIFHYGEECGGLGSHDLATEWPELLNGATIAIALDRAGTSDVITHQHGGRTASDAFAASLSAQLNLGGAFTFAPSSSGIYTDTAEYAEIIAECTNVSVGYFNAHSSREHVDVPHVLRLLDRLCTMDQSALVVARDPSVREPIYYSLDWPPLDTETRRCPRCDAWLFNDDLDCCWRCDGMIDTSTDDCYLDPDTAAIQRALRTFSMRTRSD